MGNKKPKQIRVAKDAVPDVAKVAKEIKWKFSFQTVPEGHVCPRGLDFVINLKSGKKTAKIPNPWDLWVRNPKTQSRYKVEVRKGDNAANVTDALKKEVGGLFKLVFKVTKEEINSSMMSADLFAIKNEIEIQEQEEPLQELDQEP